MTQWPLAARSFSEAFTAIAPVMNPIGCALIYPQLTDGITQAERADLARRIAVYAGLALLTAMWAGTFLLSAFGIGIGALRIAGGLVVAAEGWRLMGQMQAVVATPSLSEVSARAAFVPLTIPFTTGPGTLSAAMALGAVRPASGTDLLAYVFGMSIAAIALAALVGVLYGLADRAINWLGPNATQTLRRVSASLLLCVGAQIVIFGLHDLWP